MIKAIETAYKGYRFRSRLEARWAVFFDALGIEWQYEPEGYLLSNGVRYLPDFFLPKLNGGMFVEVKPDGGYSDKAKRLAIDTGRPVLIAAGPPECRPYKAWVPLWQANEAGTRWEVNLDDLAFVDKYLLRGDQEYRLYFQATDSDCEYQPLILEAVYAARSARFEHGESGAWRR